MTENTLLEGNNDIVVPFAHEVLQSLFGWLSKITDLPKKKQNEEEHDDEENDEEIYKLKRQRVTNRLYLIK